MPTITPIERKLQNGLVEFIVAYIDAFASKHDELSPQAVAALTAFNLCSMSGDMPALFANLEARSEACHPNPSDTLAERIEAARGRVEAACRATGILVVDEDATECFRA